MKIGNTALRIITVAPLIPAGIFPSVALLFECDGRPMEKFFVAQRVQ